MHTKYLSHIKTCFPDLTIESHCLINDGFVNDVLIINDERVFRFPKNQSWAKTLFEHELRVLSLLNSRVNMPLPKYDYIDEDMGSYLLIPGIPMYREDVLRQSESIQDRVAEQLAIFLLQMHSTPLDEVEAHAIGASDVNRDRDAWLKLFEDVRKEIFPHMMPHSRAWVTHHFDPIVANQDFMDYSPRLMNGDIPCYHLLWDDEQGAMTGVIDLGTAGVGDPAVDIACILYNYGEPFLRRMCHFYPEIMDWIDRARFWAGTLELQWLLTGLRKQEPMWHTIHIGGARDIGLIGSDL